MEWDEFFDYMNDTRQVEYLKDILKSNSGLARNINIDNIPEQLAYHKECYKLNNRCSTALDNIETYLLQLKNKLNQEVESIQNSINKESKKMEEANSYWPYVFGMPYFKDQNSFSAPPNADTINMKARNFVSTLSLPPGHLWKTEDKNFLLNSVNKYLAQKRRRLLDNNKKLSKIKAEDINLNDDDWVNIPLKKLKDRHGLVECIGMWNSYLNPKLIKRKWTRDEENKLKLCASKYNYQDWEAIAGDLNLNRSPYQCIDHLQTHFNKGVTKKKWTEEEDRKLEELVRKYQLGEYIPWAKVASHMDGRTKFQVYNHWAYTLQPNIKKGRFTKREDAIILAGIKKFGTDYGRISRFLKDRTSIQIRNRFNTFLQYQQGFQPWTSEEDILLLKLVKELGKGNWSQISSRFKNRNRTQLRHRYTAISKWMKKNPDKELNLQHRRTHSKVGGPQEMWESIVNENDLEDEDISDVINEMGLEDVTRDESSHKIIPRMLSANFYEILKGMHIPIRSYSDLDFSKQEIINFCALLQIQLEILCCTPFRFNCIVSDGTFFECTDSVVQYLKEILPSENGNNWHEIHTPTELYVPELETLNYSTHCVTTDIKLPGTDLQLLNPLPFLNFSSSNDTEDEFQQDQSLISNTELLVRNTFATQAISFMSENHSSHEVQYASANLLQAKNGENLHYRQQETEIDYFPNPGNTSNSDLIHPTVHLFPITTSVNDNNSKQNGAIDCFKNFSENGCSQERSLKLLPERNNDGTSFITYLGSSLFLNCQSPRLSFYFPPNHTTLVAFHMLHLNLPNIKKSAKLHSKSRSENETNSGDSSVEHRKSPNFLSGFSTVEAKQAALLWKQRFFSVFLWPKLMTVTNPPQKLYKSQVPNLNPRKKCETKSLVKSNLKIKKSINLEKKASQQKLKSKVTSGKKSKGILKQKPNCQLLQIQVYDTKQSKRKRKNKT